MLGRQLNYARKSKSMIREILSWLDFIIAYIPGRIGIRIRRVAFKIKVNKSGKNVNISTGVQIIGGSNIQTGSNIGINSNSVIGAHHGKITLGSRVIIGQNVVVRASDHKSESIEIPIIEQGQTGGEIIIGNDCWIGANAVITRNVKIGDHSIVAAGAVVTKDVDPFSIMAGVPARLVKKRG